MPLIGDCEALPCAGGCGEKLVGNLAVCNCIACCVGLSFAGFGDCRVATTDANLAYSSVTLSIPLGGTRGGSFAFLRFFGSAQAAKKDRFAERR